MKSQKRRLRIFICFFTLQKLIMQNKFYSSKLLYDNPNTFFSCSQLIMLTFLCSFLMFFLSTHARMQPIFKTNSKYITSTSTINNHNHTFQVVEKFKNSMCGVADAPKTPSGTEKYVYFTGQPRWNRNIPMTLKYAFSPNNMITTLSMEELRAAFKRAFEHWSSVIPVTFIESDDYGFSDIKIGFYYGDHGDGEAFDGVLGVLAHAFSPESGKFHLDAAETWAVDFEVEKSHSAVDLESVATHEIGHLLGLAHTNVKNAIMYPSLRPRERKVELKLDDIKGVQALYGSNPNFTFQGFSESDMSSSDAIDWRVGMEFIRFNWLLILILWFS